MDMLCPESRALVKTHARQGRVRTAPGGWQRPVALAVAALWSGLGVGAEAASITWKGASGSWTDAAQWSPALVPGVLDDVVVKAGTATLSVDLSIHGFTLAGGVHQGLANLSTNTLTMSAGTLGGPGRTTVTDAASFLGGSVKLVGTGHTLTLQGATTLGADWHLYVKNQGLITNASGAMITDQGTGGSTFEDRRFGEGGGTFVNEGTYVRDGTGWTHVFGLNNAGTVQVRQGVFSVDSNSQSSGVLDVLPNAWLIYSSGSSAVSGRLKADGRMRVDQATLTLTAQADLTGNVLLNHDAARLVVEGGATKTHQLDSLTIQAGKGLGTGNLSTKSLTMSAGTLGGTGRTTVTDVASFLGGSVKLVDTGHTLSLQGATTLGADWHLYVKNQGLITNEKGATITDQGTGGSTFEDRRFGEGGGTFVNEGTYVRDGTGWTHVFGLNNAGTVQVRQGVFSVDSNSQSSGVLDVLPNAWLIYSSGSSVVSGRVKADGRMRIDGATLTLTDQAELTGHVVLNDDVARLVVDGGAAKTHQLDSLTIQGGKRLGTGNLITQALTLSNGALSGAGQTTVTGATSFTGSADKTVDTGHTLVLQGPTSWGVASNVRVANKGMIINRAGATFTDLGTGGSTFEDRRFGEGGGTFVNEGTYVRDGTGWTQAYGFNNKGTLNILRGTMAVDGAFSNQGVVSIAAGGALRATGTTFGNDGLIRGTGTVKTLDAAHALANRGTIDPGEAGALGKLTVDGDLTLATGSILHIDLGLDGTSDVLAITDRLNLGGTLQLGWKPGTALQVGDVFTIATFKSLGGGAFTQVDWGLFPNMDFQVVYNVDNIQIRVSAVPEPETWGLALVGVLLAAVARRRKVV